MVIERQVHVVAQHDHISGGMNPVGLVNGLDVALHIVVIEPVVERYGHNMRMLQPVLARAHDAPLISGLYRRRAVGSQFGLDARLDLLIWPRRRILPVVREAPVREARTDRILARRVSVISDVVIVLAAGKQRVVRLNHGRAVTLCCQITRLTGGDNTAGSKCYAVVE